MTERPSRAPRGSGVVSGSWTSGGGGEGGAAGQVCVECAGESECVGRPVLVRPPHHIAPLRPICTGQPGHSKMRVRGGKFGEGGNTSNPNDKKLGLTSPFPPTLSKAWMGCAAKFRTITVTDAQIDGRPRAVPRHSPRAPHVRAAVAAARHS
eukprot:scaffold14247_cov140-Isochrysis_galbana.AAC.4